MAASQPLQVIILRHGNDVECAPFEQAAERAFKGGVAPSGYLAVGDDLGVDLRIFNACPDPAVSIQAMLDAACHTLVIAIVDFHALDDAPFLDWLTNCWGFIHQSKKRHDILLLALDERVAEKLRDKRPALQSLTSFTPQQLGERAIRTVLFSLRTLHDARVLLARALSPSPSGLQTGALRLFISHAKLDGLPLAQSLQHYIQTIPWLRSFYDAIDLASESDWENALEAAAVSSLLIVLRTDAYEQRWWCQREALWCELHAMPAVLVEARPGLSYPAGDLPLERMPSVRIPDGNLLRILNAALREGLRYLLFQRRVLETRTSGGISPGAELRVFSYPPSMPALLRICGELVSHAPKPRFILYPDPPLRAGIYEAAQALVAATAPGVQLLTLGTLAAKPVP
jgi:hypothetical protein